MTAAAVEQMNQQYGFASMGSGFIKPAAIYNVLADETTQTHAMLAELAANTDDDETCSRCWLLLTIRSARRK